MKAERFLRKSVLAIATIVIVFLTMSVFYSPARKNSPPLKPPPEILQLSAELKAQLENDTAWRNTVNDSANLVFQCLRTHSDCSTSQGPFRLLNANGEIIHDTTAESAGFDSRGKPCQSFDAFGSADSESCVFRLTLAWKPLCYPPGPCVQPHGKILGKLLSRAKNRAKPPAALVLNLFRSSENLHAPTAVTAANPGAP